MGKKNGYVVIRVQDNKPNGECHVATRGGNHEVLSHSEKLSTSKAGTGNMVAHLLAFNGLKVEYEVRNQFDETIFEDEVENPNAKDIILDYLRLHPITAALIFEELKKPK